MIFNILISGVGGQGTVLASKLIAGAAIECGFDVRTTETIGMAQRGGSVVGHTRIGDNIASPLILPGGADLLIAFEPSEAVRQLSFLSAEGTLIVCDKGVTPLTYALLGQIYEADKLVDYIKANIGKAIIVPGQPIIKQHAKMLNVALLGVAAQSGVFPFETQALGSVISKMPKFREENLEAFEIGRNIYNESIN